MGPGLNWLLPQSPFACSETFFDKSKACSGGIAVLPHCQDLCTKKRFNDPLKAILVWATTSQQMESCCWLRPGPSVHAPPSTQSEHWTSLDSGWNEKTIITAILKNMFRFEPVISGRQRVSLFESGQFPSSLVGGIMHRTLQDRETATPLIRWTACL